MTGLVGWWALLGSLVSLGLAIALLVDFDSASGALQEVVNQSWIPQLGVSFQLGVDGLSIFLVLLTSLLWAAAIVWSALQGPDRPRNYFFMLGLAQTGTLGAFLAQDLLLFVLFFDLMLIPFYFLIGVLGHGRSGRGDDQDDHLHADRVAADAGRRDRHRGAQRRRDRRGHVLDRDPPPGAAADRQPVLDLRLLLGSPSWSRCRPSSSTAGWPTPTAPARCRCSSCSAACSRRSRPTASCGS